MDGTNDRHSEIADEEKPTPAEAVAHDAKQNPSATKEDRATSTDQSAAPAIAAPSGTPPKPSEAGPRLYRWRKRLLLAVAAVFGLAGLGYVLVPWAKTALNTVSTDDAYVNGHVTFVAPRVAGQVTRVFVDDNMRVKKGDLLVQIDPEPYRVQVELKKAALEAAEANLVAAQAQVRGMVAQARANRFQLEHAMEEVRNQIALLQANVAAYQNQQAVLELARANLRRGEEMAPSQAISQEDLDQRRQTEQSAVAAVRQALETVYATRVGLGLPAKPPSGKELTEVPPNLDQNYSAVRMALAQLLQSAAPLGIIPPSYNASPKEVLDDFYRRDPEGNLDRIFAKVISDAPAIQQAQANLLQARRDLEQAELNLRYCDIPAEIDGVITRRNINPGNFVQAGQNLMAIRSLTEIWIDANFKETQLANLRIGQRVRIEVDMYGSHHEFEGRITGFTMGTGQTLALLPPQNATGNYVKIVQRLPVRIELTNYAPDEEPLFVGLSVTPYVYYKEPPTGQNAGAILQPAAPLPQIPTNPGG
jgi:membrane fusion protein (multidrug efflux system)